MKEKIRRFPKNIKRLSENIKRYLFSMWFMNSVVFIVVTVSVLFIARLVVVGLYEKKAVSNLQMEAQNRCNIIAKDIGKQEKFNYKLSDSVLAQIEQMTYSYSGRVMIVASNYAIIKDTYVAQENKILVSEAVNKAFMGNTTNVYVPDGGYIEITVPIVNNITNEVEGVLISVCSDSTIMANSQYMKDLFERIIVISSIIIVVLAFSFSYILYRPVRRLSEDISGVANGYVNRIEQKTLVAEVNNLATEVNKMLVRIKNLDDSRQEFVSNVSHELKTPIASIKVLADSLNNRDDIEIDVYKEFMRDIVDEIDRESKIIEDLLSLVRMDKTAATLNISSCNINELVERVLKRLKPLAAEKNNELVFESFRPVVAEIDEVKFNLVVMNLVENAIKYNVANGWVRVSINADHKSFYLTVADSGIGIPEDSIDMVFERFYRVDKARSRQTGGTGLGLAITKNAILMHHGEIRVFSKEGEGSTFTVRIPLTYVRG